MKIHRMEQGSDEWKAVRKGKLTASNATAIGNNGAGLKTYIKKIILNLVAEQPFKGSKDTERGHELEPIARLKYELETGETVDEVGFLEHCPFSGCSPDGLILGKKKGLEIKCRNDEKHLDILMTGKIASSTIWQMNMCMLVTGFESWVFVAYNPNFKQSLFTKEYQRDEAKIEKLKKGLENGIELLKESLDNEAVKKELNGQV